MEALPNRLDNQGNITIFIDKTCYHIIIMKDGFDSEDEI